MTSAVINVMDAKPPLIIALNVLILLIESKLNNVNAKMGSMINPILHNVKVINKKFLTIIIYIN